MGLKKVIGGFAPLLGGLLGGPAGAAVGGLISNALGVKNDEADILQAINTDPNARLKLIELQENNRARLEEMTLEAETTRLVEVNKTMRDEIKSDHAYVRNWRPTFGYAAAISWAIQMIGVTVMLLVLVITNPLAAAEVLGGLATFTGALMPIWGIALAVLGVNVVQRSKDKQTNVGIQPAPGGIVNAITNVLRK